MASLPFPSVTAGSLLSRDPLGSLHTTRGASGPEVGFFKNQEDSSVAGVIVDKVREVVGQPRRALYDKTIYCLFIC